MLAVLILSTKTKSYNIFEDAIRKSYGKELTNHEVKWFFYKGGYETNQIINDTIYVDEADNLENTYNKFLSAFKVLKTKYPEISLIFRTNLSTYLDVKNLLKYVSANNNQDLAYIGFYGEANLYSETFYGNKILHVILKKLNFGESIKFYSGAGFFISSENMDKLHHNPTPLIDDVEIGRQLGKATKNKALDRILITDNFTKISLEKYKELVVRNLLFQYKFKSANRNDDATHIREFNHVDYRNKLLCK